MLCNGWTQHLSASREFPNEKTSETAGKPRSPTGEKLPRNLPSPLHEIRGATGTMVEPGTLGGEIHVSRDMHAEVQRIPLADPWLGCRIKSPVRPLHHLLATFNQIVTHNDLLEETNGTMAYRSLREDLSVRDIE
jgi:hypothetical protein